jgi:hypothetical protein
LDRAVPVHPLISVTKLTSQFGIAPYGYYQTPTSVHSPVTSAPDSAKQASRRNACQLSDGIGVRGGGGGGEGGGEGGEGAIQVLLIVSHEFGGPVTALVHANFA